MRSPLRLLLATTSITNSLYPRWALLLDFAKIDLTDGDCKELGGIFSNINPDVPLFTKTENISIIKIITVCRLHPWVQPIRRKPAGQGDLAEGEEADSLLPKTRPGRPRDAGGRWWRSSCSSSSNTNTAQLRILSFIQSIFQPCGQQQE